MPGRPIGNSPKRYTRIIEELTRTRTAISINRKLPEPIKGRALETIDAAIVAIAPILDLEIDEPPESSRQLKGT